MGAEELLPPALMMEVCEGDAEEVESPSGVTMEESPVAVDAIAVAGEEKSGRMAAVVMGPSDVEVALAEA